MPMQVCLAGAMSVSVILLWLLDTHAMDTGGRMRVLPSSHAALFGSGQKAGMENSSRQGEFDLR